MFRLRPILFIIASCLVLVVPAQASAMMEGIGPKCRMLQETLIEMTGESQIPADGEAAIAVCVGIQAITPRETDLGVTPSTENHAPSSHTRLAIAKRPSGIERPPQG